MRLARLTLERYGPFDRLDLPLDVAPGRLNLLVAPNGFGKSVIRRGIGDLLFGIPERTPMDFRFGTERMRLLADVLQGGKQYAVVRRKGRGNTLASADGTPIPPELVQRIFGAADETMFRELFGLDTALLRSGGQALVRSQGRLGEVLFAAGGGIGRVRDLLAQLERQRDEFGQAGVRHRSRPIWRAFSDLEEARASLKKAALKPDSWSRLEQEAEEASQRLKALHEEREALAAERDRLCVNRAVRPWLDRLRLARDDYEKTQDAPDVDASFEARWRKSLEEAVQAASRLADREADLARECEARATLSFDQAWLDAASQIEALGEMRGRSQGALKDLPGVQDSLAETRRRCASLRRDLGWPDAVALPPAPAVGDALRRLRERPKLAADAEAAETQRAEAEAELGDRQQALAAIPAPEDTERLAALAGMLRAEGDPAVRCKSAADNQRAAASALRAACAAIPDRPHAEADLQITAPLSEPELDFVERALADAELNHRECARAAASLRADSEAGQARLDTLVQTAKLPAPGALAAAREQRDALLARLCADPASKAPDTILLLDRAMHAADAVADALIEHAKEAAEAAALRTELDRLAQKQTIAQAKLADDASRLSKARADFVALAARAGSTAPNVASLRAFRRARDEAVSRLLKQREAETEEADMRAQLAALGEPLAAALGVSLPPVEALGTLLAEADRRIAAAKGVAAQRASLERQVETQRRTLAERAKAAAKTRAKLDVWEQAWAETSPALARPHGETLQATEEALALIEELRARESERASNALRVSDMQRDIAKLQTEVAALLPLAPDLYGLQPVEAAQALERRLLDERQRSTRCLDADELIKKRKNSVEEARDTSAEAMRSLAGLRAALRADTDEAAETQLHRARTARDARRNRDEAERELARQGGGLPVEALAERCASSSEDADALRVAGIDVRLAELVGLIETAQEQRLNAAKARKDAEDGEGAAEAAARRESAQAELARSTEEALLFHAAHALLQTALDRQAEGADQPLLRRIGEVFATITGGAYAGVAIEDTKAGQVMVAIESEGGVRKSLEHLSEGTSDQLYLALRIAALEQSAANAPPLPFIVDDVLQTFDDPRTESTLRALLSLSDHVQVIALTHHRHVERLATDMPIHVLDPCAAAV